MSQSSVRSTCWDGVKAWASAVLLFAVMMFTLTLYIIVSWTVLHYVWTFMFFILITGLISLSLNLRVCPAVCALWAPDHSVWVWTSGSVQLSVLWAPDQSESEPQGLSSCLCSLGSWSVWVWTSGSVQLSVLSGLLISLSLNLRVCPAVCALWAPDQSVFASDLTSDTCWRNLQPSARSPSPRAQPSPARSAAGWLPLHPSPAQSPVTSRVTELLRRHWDKVIKINQGECSSVLSESVRPLPCKDNGLTFKSFMSYNHNCVFISDYTVTVCSSRTVYKDGWDVSTSSNYLQIKQTFSRWELCHLVPVT